ncbi:motile sperm domain-containing protein 2-like [Brevipalpus obovatus]|uniref:motile sperm domain-containing protein 2-like n=1 Tax=Brevipalpus obovatus TaxID=246614 RepID=UPI003D9E946C
MKLTPNTQSLPINYPDNVLLQVRDKLSAIAEKCPETLDSELLQRLMTEDALLQRYIRRRSGEIDSAVSFIRGALEWRKRLGFPDFTLTSFPKEFYEVGGIYLYKEDIHGNVVLHIRIRLFQKVEGMLDLLKKFSIYLMYQADELAAAKGPEYGWVLLFDCTEAGIANADIDMANFVISTLRNYFPSGQKYVLVHKLPWLLNAVKSLIFAMLPSYVKRKIKFCDEKGLKDHIPVENLPDYLGGPATHLQYRINPEGTVSTKDLARKGLMPMSDEQLSKVHQYYDKLRAFLYPE